MTGGLTNIENRKRLQATRALFMTIERRQVKESLLLNKQNKEIQRLEKLNKFFIRIFSSLCSLVELKETERLHQEESLAQRQISTINTNSGYFEYFSPSLSIRCIL